MEATLRLVVVLILAAGCAAYAGVHGDGGFSVELIHRDSAKSPFHDPKLTRHERFLAAARRSRARAAKLLVSANGGGGGGASSDLFYGDFEYLAAVNVGTPPVRFLAAADTASDLVWLKCNTTQANNNNNGIVSSGSGNAPPEAVVHFNPFESSSYSRVGCDGASCRALGGDATCNADSRACDFHHSYNDGRSATGLLAADAFTFFSDAGSKNSAASIDFGCGTGTVGEFQADGVVGLGPGPVSLASQLGRKFSFCLTAYDVDGASSTLSFGARAVVSDPGAATTPLVVSGSGAALYRISIESLKVAGQPVPGTTSPSNITVDTGTALTFLDRAALLAPLLKELARVMDGAGLPRAPAPDETLELCYDVSGVKGQVDDVIPDVTLVLGGGGGEVRLSGEGTFVLVKEGVLCLAVVATSKEQPLPVLGNVALQDLHVGLDLNKRTATFATDNCDTSSQER